MRFSDLTTIACASTLRLLKVTTSRKMYFASTIPFILQLHQSLRSFKFFQPLSRRLVIFSKYSSSKPQDGGQCASDGSDNAVAAVTLKKSAFLFSNSKCDSTPNAG